MPNTENPYNTRSKSKFLLYVHVVLVVKYRKKLLIKYGNEIQQKIREISGKRWRLEKSEVDQDHIHLLIEYDPQASVSKIVRSIKSQTAFHLWESHGHELQHEFWKKHTFWSPSYFACSVGNASKTTVERYIQNQG